MSWSVELAVVFKAALLGPLISRSKKMSIVMWKPNTKEDLDFLTELLESGKVVPVIDRHYPLSEVPEALRYLEEEPHQGKIVITVEHNQKKPNNAQHLHNEAYRNSGR